MSFSLEKEFRFEAAHRLVHHDGHCARLHGHSWRGRIICEGNRLYEEGPKRGMLIDYADMSAALRPVLETYLDHHFLNETLQTDSPTSEVIAAKLFFMLVQELPNLTAVVIEETCTSRCTFRPDQSSIV